MNDHLPKLAPVLFTLLAAVALPSLSAADPPVISIGGSFGATRLEHDAAAFDDGSWSAVRRDDTDSGWKLFGNVRLSPHWAVEVGYADLNGDVDSETTFSATADGSGSFAGGAVTVDIDEPTAAYATVVGLLPFGDRFSAFLKGGFHAWDADVTTADSTGTTTVAESGEDGIVGIGVEVKLGKRLLLRAEIERFFGVVGDDFDLASMGFAVRFGSGG